MEWILKGKLSCTVFEIQPYSEFCQKVADFNIDLPQSNFTKIFGVRKLDPRLLCGANGDVILNLAIFTQYRRYSLSKRAEQNRRTQGHSI